MYDVFEHQAYTSGTMKRVGEYMKDTVLQDVAYLFVEQYEDLAEHYKRADVDLIRATAEKGEAALYIVVATIFGPKLDQALLGAAHGGMDYIAYSDETWEDMPEDQQKLSAELAELHLESVKTIVRLSQQNECRTAEEITVVYDEAEQHMNRIREKAGGPSLF